MVEQMGHFYYWLSTSRNLQVSSASFGKFDRVAPNEATHLQPKRKKGVAPVSGGIEKDGGPVAFLKTNELKDQRAKQCLFFIYIFNYFSIKFGITLLGVFGSSFSPSAFF